MQNTRPRTAADLERKYLDKIENIETSQKAQNKTIQKLQTETLNYVNAINDSLDELQRQVDGNITTYFYSGVPTLLNEPAVEWTTTTEKEKHIGDLYYDQDTGYAYRFYLDGTTETFGWSKIVDADVTEALAVANAAKDTADSKRTTYYSQPTPPYDLGDIWIRNNEIYRCIVARLEGATYNPSDWINDLKYTDDTIANQAVGALNQFKEEVEDTYATNSSLQTTINSINGQVSSILTTTAENTQALSDLNASLDSYLTADSETIVDIKKDVTALQTDSQVLLNFKTEVDLNGVKKVETSTGYKFDEDGLSIDKSGSKTKQVIDDKAVSVIDKSSSNGEILQYTGYVDSDVAQSNPELNKYVGETITYSKNIDFSKYLASKNWRIEETTNDNNEVGLGFFYTGE